MSLIPGSSLRFLYILFTLYVMSEVTRILSAVEQGDRRAADQLLPLIYDELRLLASQRLAREKPGQTLQATALVHEAYLRLAGGSAGPEGGSPQSHWKSRGHFFAAAAEAMRRILVENARRKKSAKHGGDRQRVDLAEVEIPCKATPEQILNLDEALANLEQEDEAACALAKLRLYTGISVEEASEALGISRATAYRQWAFARAWLHTRLGELKDQDIL